MEVGFHELNEWAGRITESATPEELWGNLMNKEARIDRIEQLVDKWEERGPWPPSARTNVQWETRLANLEAKVEGLENAINEIKQEMKDGNRSAGKNARKPISE